MPVKLFLVAEVLRYFYNQPKPYFISVIYGLSLQLQYGKLEKSLKCQKVWYPICLGPSCPRAELSGTQHHDCAV
jgi:hypothetical protein